MVWNNSTNTDETIKNGVLAVGVVSIILFAVVFLFIGPVFTIWALNAVFGMNIPLTFCTYLSVMWLHYVISRSSSAASK